MEQTMLTLILIGTYIAIAWAAYTLGCIVTMRRMSSSFARELFMTINTIKALAEVGKKMSEDASKPETEAKV